MIPYARTIIVGLVILSAALGALAYINHLRTKIEHVTAERDAALTQASILADAVKRCSEGVDAAKKASKLALDFGAKALEEAKKRNAPLGAQLARMEELLRKPPPNGTCDDAWRVIESEAG